MYLTNCTNKNMYCTSSFILEQCRLIDLLGWYFSLWGSFSRFSPRSLLPHVQLNCTFDLTVWFWTKRFWIVWELMLKCDDNTQRKQTQRSSDLYRSLCCVCVSAEVNLLWRDQSGSLRTKERSDSRCEADYKAKPVCWGQCLGVSACMCVYDCQ